MPSLGFLKKKRTREAHPDPPSSSQPTSPVTPTATKTFEQAFRSSNSIASTISASTTTASTTAVSTTTASTASTVPRSGAVPHPADQSDRATGRASSSAVPVMASTPVLQHAQPASPASMLSPGADTQNLPTISNLINAPHADGAVQSYQPGEAQAAYVATPGSGGAIPQVALATQAHTADAQSQQQVPQAQPAALAQPTYQQQQMASQRQPPSDQARVTKGKYSLADFEILRTLGTGSFGRVHLVQSRHNQRFYAVKVLKKAQVVRMKQVEHTNDERRMLAEVKNPFLITLWGTFQDSRNLYMVMDFVEGGELFSLLRKSAVSNRLSKAGGVNAKILDRHESDILTAFPKPCGQVLRGRSHTSARIPTLAQRHLPRPEARKPTP